MGIVSTLAPTIFYRGMYNPRLSFPSVSLVMIRLFPLIFFQSLFSATSSAAEFWSCGGETAAPLLTDAPARSDGAPCTRLDFSHTPFQRLPADQFSALGRPSPAKTDSARGNSPGLDTAGVGAKESTAQRPHRLRGRLNLDRNFGSAPSASFSAKEISGRFEIRCEISGTARSENGGEGFVRIRRGALTVDEVAVRLAGEGRPVKWRTMLKGPCRNPEVKVSLK